MVLYVTQPLEAALTEQALQRGVTPEVLALAALRDRFLPTNLIEPQDEWERALFGAAVDCGVSIPNSALSSDGLYDSHEIHPQTHTR